MAILADKTKELIELLSDKTNDNTIQWTRTSADDGFQYIFKKGSIIINNSYDFNLDRAYMNLILFNDIGEVIEDTYVNSDEEKNYFNYFDNFMLLERVFSR